MHIFFGLQFDDWVCRQIPKVEGGVYYLGSQGLLNFLERQTGLAGHPANQEYLRIEQYRQAIKKHLGNAKVPFYTNSFQADQLGTATSLLELRDELLLAGWNFKPKNTLSQRLLAFSEIEQLIQKDNALKLNAGYADRFRLVFNTLDRQKSNIAEFTYFEPFSLLPPFFQMLISKFEKLGVEVRQYHLPDATEQQSDLGRFQNLLIRSGSNELQKGGVIETGPPQPLAPEGEPKLQATRVDSLQGLRARAEEKKTLEIKPPQKRSFNADGSLIILHAERDTGAATFLAKLCKENPAFKPTCFIPKKEKTLDNAVVQEGLPSMGILSTSLARPSLQILKLVPVFLWNPVDPFKILEFVSLPNKPLDERLANAIAQQMAQKPGLYSDSWRQMIRLYFEGLENSPHGPKRKEIRRIKDQYNKWFGRKRYDIRSNIPKEEALDIFSYLAEWAKEAYEENAQNHSTLLVLSEQARRICELLETLPESEARLSNLELERIVRTIYEPAPIRFQAQEVDHLPHFHLPGALVDSPDELVWWNFIRAENSPFFSRWYPTEIASLESQDISLETPARKNARLVWHRRLPVLKTKKRLVLVIPKWADGNEVYPHALHDLLEANFSNLEDISFSVDNRMGISFLNNFLQLPEKEKVPLIPLQPPQPFLQLVAKAEFHFKKNQYLTALEDLIYYPHQWHFRNELLLKKSSILSIVRESTLLGNLAHRFFELLFREPLADLDRNQVYNWIDSQSQKILSREGAVLLLYGKEVEREAFFKTLKRAAWTLVSLIRENQWEVVGTEKSLEGDFLNIPVRGKMDLLLERGEEQLIVDLKWRGATRRQRMLANREDLQLVMYAHMQQDGGKLPHTAYYIIDQARMIARNNLAVANCIAADPKQDHQITHKDILSQMEATLQWRIQQLEKGFIEIRTESTSGELDEFYGEQLLSVLEMKTGNAPFEDYGVLIGLIN